VARSNDHNIKPLADNARERYSQLSIRDKKFMPVLPKSDFASHTVETMLQARSPRLAPNIKIVEGKVDPSLFAGRYSLL
jgi:hypothetical protein